MKKVYEYDFSYQANEAIEDAIRELNNTKRYLSESMNGTIENLGELDLDLKADKFTVKFMLDYATIIEEDYEIDRVFDWFLDWNEGEDHELESCKTLKINILKCIEKLEERIKRIEEK